MKGGVENGLDADELEELDRFKDVISRPPWYCRFID